MRVALISFHKNISRYPKEWITKYRNSILNQTNTRFDIIELNYGGTYERIFNESTFIIFDLPDHAQAHNYLLKYCFDDGYDYVLNTNVDDYYPNDRVEIQLANFDDKYAVISGNYAGFRNYDDTACSTKFDAMNIAAEFGKNHNIITHPACAYTRTITKYDECLKSNEIPRDDFCMWKRLLAKGAEFKILNNILLYYRISNLKTSTNGI